MRLEAVVVVGASQAGLAAAETLRREGFEGRLTIVGEEPHAPYQRPPLSKQLLAGAWPPEKVRLRASDDLRAELCTGTRATGLDLVAGTVTVTTDGGDEKRLPFDGLVVATGARPRRLPGRLVPDGFDGVHVLRTLDDALALRDALQAHPRVVVIGAGFIGCEVAATCRGLGLDVTVVEPVEAPMQRALGTAMGGVLAGIHRGHGVDLRLGRSASAVLGDGRVEAVRLDDGAVVDADLVVAGLGVETATGWLEGCGLRLDDGVVCDAACRAEGAEGVVAAGDVARWFHPRSGAHVRVEHWDNAAQQGAAAARSLLHGDAAASYDPIPWFWSRQYDVRLQLLGLPQPDDEVAVVEGDPEQGRFVAAYGRDGRTVAVLTVNAVTRTSPYRPLLEAGAPFPPEPPAQPDTRPAPEGGG